MPCIHQSPPSNRLDITGMGIFTSAAGLPWVHRLEGLLGSVVILGSEQYLSNKNIPDSSNQ